jgi:hypothetical protein
MTATTTTKHRESSYSHKRRIQAMATLFLIVLLLPRISASKPSASTSHHPIKGRSTRRSRIPRTLQSWVIHQKAIPKTRSLGKSSATTSLADAKGSVLTFFKPTKVRIANWFGVEQDQDPDQVIQCMLRKEFNHGT